MCYSVCFARLCAIGTHGIFLECQNMGMPAESILATGTTSHRVGHLHPHTHAARAHTHTQPHTTTHNTTHRIQHATHNTTQTHRHNPSPTHLTPLRPTQPHSTPLNPSPPHPPTLPRPSPALPACGALTAPLRASRATNESHWKLTERRLRNEKARRAVLAAAACQQHVC